MGKAKEGDGKWEGRKGRGTGAPAGFFPGGIGGGRGQWLEGTMASAEHEPITGGLGQSP